MPDSLGLLKPDVPLQTRYDQFLVWLSSRSHAVIEMMADELGLTVSEVDVFNELGELDPEEFDIIDRIGFDIGLLFILLRAPKGVRQIMYDKHQEILQSQQPLSALKHIVDQHSDYTSIMTLVEKISGNCWKAISSYLKQRNIISGTITKSIRPMLIQVGNRVINQTSVSERQWGWIVRAIEHDHSKSLGVFTNETIKTSFEADHLIFTQIHQHITKYGGN